MTMYLQHQMRQPVFPLKYFTPDSHAVKDTKLHHGDGEGRDRTKTSDTKKGIQSFLDPNEKTFAAIRQRLSTLTLNTDYKSSENTNIHSQFHGDRSRIPPKRLSSLSSHDTVNKVHESHVVGNRLQSRVSFKSDDHEYRSNKRSNRITPYYASETASLNKLNENLLTPGQNPELFSRQIKLSEGRNVKRIKSRSTSPKCVKTVDSSGKVHLGLIESLDLNERLNDVEKIKERYSNENFIHSLAMYKMRGHDKCLRQTGMSEYIPRGTKLSNAEETRAESQLLNDSMNSIPSTMSSIIGDRTRPLMVTSSKWDPNHRYLSNQSDARSRVSSSKSKRTMKSKKSVGFAAEHQELSLDDVQDVGPPPSVMSMSSKEPKSILKRPGSRSTNKDTIITDTSDDEFLIDERYRWKFHLPKIHSPVQSFRTRPPLSFRRKMYHFGDGVSDEFDQVIAKYGNCRQSSWVREHSYVRDTN